MKRAPTLTLPSKLDVEGIIAALQVKDLGIPIMCSGKNDFKCFFIIADA